MTLKRPLPCSLLSHTVKPHFPAPICVWASKDLLSVGEFAVSAYVYVGTSVTHGVKGSRPSSLMVLLSVGDRLLLVPESVASLYSILMTPTCSNQGGADNYYNAWSTAVFSTPHIFLNASCWARVWTNQYCYSTDSDRSLREAEILSWPRARTVRGTTTSSPWGSIPLPVRQLWMVVTDPGVLRVPSLPYSCCLPQMVCLDLPEAPSDIFLYN